MAAAYIDEAYVNARLGSGYVDAVQATTGIDLTKLIETATGRVQSALRANGYGTPATTTDETVKEAVLGALIELITSIPEVKVAELTHPALKVYADLVDPDGILEITHEITNIAAVGGSQFTESDPLVSESRPQRSARKNLIGY